MLKKSIVVSKRTYLSTRDEQLLVNIQDEEEISSIPIEDIGYMEVDTGAATITSSLVTKLMQGGSIVVFCDTTHHPVGMLLPITANTLHARVLRNQANASLPICKRSWQEIVRCKLRNQATVLEQLGMDSTVIKRRIPRVMSADSTNQEGVAAAAYWKIVLSAYDTQRDPDGPYPNNVLNYGYAVIRAAVARAIVLAGLHPALGIKHTHRNNSFALADDVMEPYRPILDLHILHLIPRWADATELTRNVKSDILEVLYTDTLWPDGRRPLINAVQKSATSLAQVFAGERELPVFPTICE